MKTIEERFWAKVDVRGPNECWLWKAGMKGKYGAFSMGEAHRVSFKLWWGVSLPRWLDVCHDCPGGDNPACCNPEHLFISDRKGHFEDRKRKGQIATGDRHGSRTHPERIPRGDRHYAHIDPKRSPHGEKHHRASLTELQVIGIMARFLQGATRRQIANEYQASYGAVKHIVSGHTWKWLFEGEAS